MDKSVKAPLQQPRQTRRSLPMALLRARENVMEYFRPMLERHGVTEQQWRVLRVVAEAGELDATEVAARASILAPSLTRIIRTLEQRKLVRRHRDTRDGRRVMLAVTANGEALIHKAVPESLAAHHALEQRFGAEKLNMLLDLLDALTTKDR
jgi:homoprotocatechuate degradation regulator HpaR